MSHLLVTNDYPPKVGGIQSYLYELWRRLDSDRFIILTRQQPGSEAFDANAGHRVVRVRAPLLLPTHELRSRIERLIKETKAELVVLDPALPLGKLGPRLSVPYAVVLHGAEITVPARLPVISRVLSEVIGSASLVISAGGYPLGEARRLVRKPFDSVLVPPGVDTTRFVPLSVEASVTARRSFGLQTSGRLVVSVSRLVPRKGVDVLIEAAALLRDQFPDLHVAIGGTGRDRARLERLIEKKKAPVGLLGRIKDEELSALFGCADIFAMLCRTRWFGLEQEGFGIVFLEAASCGVPQLAGRSGGACEAVLEGETGYVADRPGDVVVVAAALRRMLEDPEGLVRLGTAARKRAVTEFDYDGLAGKLGVALGRHGG